jgi:Transposase IS116/IS110/IS902 family
LRNCYHTTGKSSPPPFQPETQTALLRPRQASYGSSRDAYFGTDRERYQSAYQMQCYSGIAPVKEASGNTVWVHSRFICPKFLRQTFHEFAEHSIGQSEWAKAYYDHLIQDEKKSHHAAVRALAFKWIRIVFRCWKDRKPYDEEIYTESQRRRRSLLGRTLGTLDAATGAGWNTIAGFQRFSKNNA